MHKNTTTKYSAFTTTSEGQNESLLSFFPSAVGAKAASKKKVAAFTLIELLVVIAIIGILSAIVLAALGSARSNAKEASILSSLNSARTQAELYHVNNGSYSGLCSDEKIQEIVANASSTGDGAACWEATNSSTYVEPTPASPAQLAMIDYGIGARLDDTYYGASPLGSGTFDNENRSDSGWDIVNWSTAKTICINAEKRLPSPSAFRSIWGIADGTPEDFTASGHWSALESPAYSSEAYRTYLNDGSVYQDSKSYGGYIRCID